MIGIIGGSGLYDIKDIVDIKELDIDTPFGIPSDKVITGKLNGIHIAFLSRHGKGHRISPTEINYRANIYAMKKVGVECIISVSAVGSMKKELRPGDIILVDQFYDNTKQRISTFFGNGLVAHVSFAEPICTSLRELLYNTAKELKYTVHMGGTYLCMEGPQFSTKAESNIYRKWGVDVIGMTNVTEAKLAREAELCYATLAMVTDYDCWKDEHVTVEMVIKTLTSNISKAKNIIKQILPKIDNKKSCTCNSALENTIMTPKESVPQKTLKDLELIIAKHIK